MLFGCLGGEKSSTTPVELVKRDSSHASVLFAHHLWFSENLKVERFRNGDRIECAKSIDEWLRFGEQQIPAYAYYNFDSLHYAHFGKLYNWFAVEDNREIAPVGWHIPSEREWKELEIYCDSLYGRNLDIENPENFHLGTVELLMGDEWQADGSHLSGFRAIPAGYLDDFGYFSGLDTGWWSDSPAYSKHSRMSNEKQCEDCAYCFIVNSMGRDYHNVASKSFGFYVRCVSDLP